MTAILLLGMHNDPNASINDVAIKLQKWYKSMINAAYSVTKEKCTLGNRSKASYGRVAYAITDKDGTATIVASVHDITSDKFRLKKLVDDCNQLELSTVHLHDIVEDFLSD